MLFLASSIPGDESATNSKVQELSSASAPRDESAAKSKVPEPSSAAAQSQFSPFLLLFTAEYVQATHGPYQFHLGYFHSSSSPSP